MYIKKDTYTKRKCFSLVITTRLKGLHARQD